MAPMSCRFRYRQLHRWLGTAFVPLAALAAWPSGWMPAFIAQSSGAAASIRGPPSCKRPAAEFGRTGGATAWPPILSTGVVTRDATAYVEGSGPFDRPPKKMGWNTESTGTSKWWETTSKGLIGKLQTEESTDAIEKLRKQLTYEEAAFEQEIDDIVIAGKKALLRLRMQKAVEMPGMNWRLFKQIRRQIARALTLRREREIARGISKEQSRRMKRRRKLELKIQYEDAYGGEDRRPKSRKWLRRMGRIV